MLYPSGIWAPPSGPQLLVPNQAFIRRDMPELLLPDSTDWAQQVPSTSANWTVSASFTQLVASLAQDTVLRMVGVSGSEGLSIAGADVGATAYGLWDLHVYTGAAAAETEICRCTYCVVVNASVTGTAAGTAGSVLGGASSQIAICPLYIPSGTRLTAKSSIYDRQFLDEVKIWLLGYDASAYCNPKHPLDVDKWIKGYSLGAHRTWPPAGAASGTQADTAVTTHATNAWSTSVEATGYGNWAQLDGSLDADYLVTGLSCILASASSKSSCVVNLGLGGAGSEVVQARSGFPRYGSNFCLGGYHPFADPFIAFKGERLAVRAKAQAANKTYQIVVHGMKLQEAWS